MKFGLNTVVLPKKEHLGAMPCLCWTRKKPKPEAAAAQKVTEDDTTDLWVQAERALQSDTESAKLMKSYKKILSEHLNGSTIALATAGSADPQKQMSALITNKLQEMDVAKWKFHIGDE